MGRKKKNKTNVNGEMSSASARKMLWEKSAVMPPGKRLAPIFLSLMAIFVLIFLTIAAVGLLNVDTNIFLRCKEFEIGLQINPHDSNPISAPQEGGNFNAP